MGDDNGLALSYVFLFFIIIAVIFGAMNAHPLQQRLMQLEQRLDFVTRIATGASDDVNMEKGTRAVEDMALKTRLDFIETIPRQTLDEQLVGKCVAVVNNESDTYLVYRCAMR